jgi:predicted DNA-binding transcriptional regulator YafY
LRARGAAGVAPNDAPLTPDEDALVVIEDGAASKRPVNLIYESVSRGDRGPRIVSVHRVEYGEAIRFVGTCHRSDTLKWFRADRASQARLEDEADFRHAAEDDIARFVAESFHGYRGEDDAQSYAFRIRWPEGRWAIRNLPHPFVDEPHSDHVRVVIETAGLDALARHLVGLGDLVTAETDALRAKMVELARGVLMANGEPRKVDGRAVGSKRAAG